MALVYNWPNPARSQCRRELRISRERERYLTEAIEKLGKGGQGGDLDRLKRQLRDVERENATSKERLRRAEQEVLDLTAEKKAGQFVGVDKSCPQRLERLQGVLGEKDKEIVQLRAGLRDCQERSQRLEQEKRQIQKELDTGAQQIRDLLRRGREASTGIADTDAILRRCNDQVLRLTEDVDTEKDKQRTLKKEKDGLIAKLETTVLHIEQEAAAKKVIQVRLEASLEQIKELEAGIEEKTEAVDAIAEAERQKHAAEAKLGTKTKEMEALRAEIARVKASNERMRRRVTSVNREVTEEKEATRKASEVASGATRLVKGLREEINKQKTELLIKQELLESQDQDLRLLLAGQEKWGEARDVAEAGESEAEMRLEASSREIKTLRQEIEVAKSQIAGLSGRLDAEKASGAEAATTQSEVGARQQAELQGLLGQVEQKEAELEDTSAEYLEKIKVHERLMEAFLAKITGALYPIPGRTAFVTDRDAGKLSADFTENYMKIDQKFRELEALVPDPSKVAAISAQTAKLTDLHRRERESRSALADSYTTRFNVVERMLRLQDQTGANIIDLVQIRNAVAQLKARNEELETGLRELQEALGQCQLEKVTLSEQVEDLTTSRNIEEQRAVEARQVQQVTELEAQAARDIHAKAMQEAQAASVQAQAELRQAQKDREWDRSQAETEHKELATQLAAQLAAQSTESEIIGIVTPQVAGATGTVQEQHVSADEDKMIPKFNGYPLNRDAIIAAWLTMHDFVVPGFDESDLQQIQAILLATHKLELEGKYPLPYPNIQWSEDGSYYFISSERFIDNDGDSLNDLANVFLAAMQVSMGKRLRTQLFRLMKAGGIHLVPEEGIYPKGVEISYEQILEANPGKRFELGRPQTELQLFDKSRRPVSRAAEPIPLGAAPGALVPAQASQAIALGAAPQPAQSLALGSVLARVRAERGSLFAFPGSERNPLDDLPQAAFDVEREAGPESRALVTTGQPWTGAQSQVDPRLLRRFRPGLVSPLQHNLPLAWHANLPPVPGSPPTSSMDVDSAALAPLSLAQELQQSSTGSALMDVESNAFARTHGQTRLSRARQLRNARALKKQKLF